MLARIADDLGGGVEAHRLRVQQRAGERRRIAPLQPARHVDQMREARRVAFREAIFAEALDLVEAALSELRIVAALAQGICDARASKNPLPLAGGEEPRSGEGVGA